MMNSGIKSTDSLLIIASSGSLPFRPARIVSLLMASQGLQTSQIRLSGKLPVHQVRQAELR